MSGNAEFLQNMGRLSMIPKYQRSTFFLFLTLFHLVVSSQAEEQSILISRYLERTAGQKKYACAMFCESTQINQKSSQGDSYAEFWYLHTYDPETNSRRHDHHMQSGISDVKSLSPGIYATLIHQDKKSIRQSLSRNTQRPVVDIENKEEDDIDKELSGKVFRQTFFDPLFLPFRGASCFNPDSGIILVADYQRSLKKYRWKEEEERGPLIIQSFQPVHQDLYDVIAFDDRVDGMPVLLTRTFGKGGKFYESIATTWHKANDQWYPIVSESKQNIGPNERSRKLKYYWMFEDFPKGIFPEGNAAPLHGSELKEAIVNWSDKYFKKESERSSK